MAESTELVDSTLKPVSDFVGVTQFSVEHTLSIKTGQHRVSLKLSDFAQIYVLRSLFASVVVTEVTAEARQAADVHTDPGTLRPTGHVFLAMIPSRKDTDADTGTSRDVVIKVPNKQTFPLSSNEQKNSVFNFNLLGFEVDLAQDPRRGAGPVAWIGNSGITTATGGVAVSIATVTWRIRVSCSGSTALW